MGCGLSKACSSIPTIRNNGNKSLIGSNQFREAQIQSSTSNSAIWNRNIIRVMKYRKYLCNTEITFEWLHKILEDTFKVKDESPTWTAERIGIDAKSTMIHVRFSWNNALLPPSVVLKVQSPMEETREDANYSSEKTNKMLRAIHARECFVYNWMAEQEIHQYVPLIFYAQQTKAAMPGVIIMEDFLDRCYHPDLVGGLTIQAVQRILDILAVVHAKSLISDEWKVQLDLLPRSHFEWIFPDEFSVTKQILQTHCSTIFAAIDKVEHFLDREFIENLVNETEDIPPVIVHGDLCMSNFIFDNSDPRTLLALVDWQESHPGNIGEDLATLFVYNLGQDIRLKETNALLKYYHSKLEEQFELKQCPISLDKIHRNYKKLIPFAMVHFLSKLPRLLEKDLVIDSGFNLTNRRQVLMQRAGNILDEIVAEIDPFNVDVDNAQNNPVIPVTNVPSEEMQREIEQVQRMSSTEDAGHVQEAMDFGEIKKTIQLMQNVALDKIHSLNSIVNSGH